MKLSNNYLAFWLFVLAGTPLWWLSGLILFSFHMTAALLFFLSTYNTTRESKGIFLPLSFYLLLMLNISHAFSLFLHLREAGGDRAVASIYNMSFWTMGWMLVVVLANHFQLKDIKPVARVFAVLATIIGIVVLLIMAAHMGGMRTLRFATPLYEPVMRVMGHTPLLESSLVVNLLHLDWLTSGSFPRFVIFSPYATATGYMMIIVLMMLFAWGGIERQYKKPWFWFLVSSNLFALVMTLSRTALIAFMVSFVVAYMLHRKRSLFILVFLLLITALAGSLISDAVEWILNLRPGSTATRTELYKYSFQQLEGIDWILGYGYRPRDETAFGIPIGSHSTYLSLMFKSGLMGTLSFFFFQVALVSRWYLFRNEAKRNRSLFFIWRALGGIFVGVGICLVTGDLDAPQTLAFFYFSSVGIFEACLWRSRQKTKPAAEPPPGDRRIAMGAFST